MRGQVSAVVMIVLAAIASGPVAAADVPDAQAAAQVAAEVAEQHCPDVAAGGATAYAEALAEVTPALRDVSQAFDSTRKVYLLYWRGLLSGCVGQEQRAAEDLQAFVEGVGDRPSFAGQVEDAQRRLMRLRGATPTTFARPSHAGPVIAGVAMLGACGALGGLAGWQGGLAQTGQREFIEGTRLWDDTAGIGESAVAAADASNGLLVGAIGAGLGGAVALVVTAATNRAPKVATGAVPLPGGGVALTMGGRW